MPARSMNNYGTISVLLLAGMMMLYACGKPSQPTATDENPQITVITPTPSPTPAPTPVPTPALAGPGFPGIRANKEIIREPDKLAKYSRNLSGKKIGGWVGRVTQISPDMETSGVRLVVEMDLDQKDPRYFLPDTVLQNIPPAVASQLRTDQVINFGGIIEGFIDFENYKNILSIRDVWIFGLLESAAPEIQDAAAAHPGEGKIE